MSGRFSRKDPWDERGRWISGPVALRHAAARRVWKRRKIAGNELSGGQGPNLEKNIKINNKSASRLSVAPMMD